MPTPRFTAPRTKGAAPTASSRRRWARRSRDRRLLEHDLRNAIARDELQPRLPAAEGHRHRRGGRLRSAVALAASAARRDPARVFIPIAEESGADPADRRMGAAHRVPRGGELGAAADVAVNVSAVQLHHAELCPSGPRDPVPDRACGRAASSSRSPRRRWSAISTARWRRCARSRRWACASRWTISAPAIRRCPICGPSRSTRSRSTARSSGRSTATNRPPRSCAPCSGSAAALGLPVLAEGVETAAELRFLEERSLRRSAGLSARRVRPRSSSSGI